MIRDRHHGKSCPYCQRPMDRANARLLPTRDHVMPQSRGGHLGTIICCITCNGIKADMLPEAWEAFMEAHPGWWKLTKYELRLIRRAAQGLQPLRKVRRARRVKQGSARVVTVVPPELIFTERSIT